MIVKCHTFLCGMRALPGTKLCKKHTVVSVNDTPNNIVSLNDVRLSLGLPISMPLLWEGDQA